jgi:glucose/arabinose dehydrogenase
MSSPLISWLKLLSVITAVCGLLLVVGLQLAVAQDGSGPAEPGGAPPPGSGPFEINNFVRVIDGDTIEVDLEGSRVGVGLIGIAAPQGNTACGMKATDLLQSLVAEGVRLEEDPNISFDGRDRRMYYAIMPDGRSVAEELVKAGVARANGRGREAEKLAALQTEASLAQTGCLWGGAEPQGTVLSTQSNDATAANKAVSTAQLMDGGQISAAAVGGGFVHELVAGGLNLPTAFAFLPDGRTLIAEKSGIVRVYKDGNILPTPFIDISEQVNDYWDHGLLGIAVDPNFAQNGYVYLLFTYEDDPTRYDGPKTGRLIRVTASGDVATPGSETVILGKQVGSTCKNFAAGADCIPSEGPSHSVGNVKAASDGSLFVTVGDATTFNFVDDDALRTQDLDSLAGKVLHVDRDGKGLQSNPFWNGNADANRSKVWAYGVRNAYRFNLRPGTEVPYLGDVGWGSWEEISVAARGANLGWPCYEASARSLGYEPKAVCQALYAAGQSAVRQPLVEWPHSGGSAAATGGAFYTGTTYPEEYQGKYFYGDYALGWMRSLQVDANDQAVGAPSDFLSGLGGPVDIEMGPDGNLYYLAINGGKFLSVRYDDGSQPVTCPKGSFRAEYFNNTTVSGALATERCEDAIDNVWGGAGPDAAGVGTDFFSARWTGTFDFEAGDYTFSATADDGVRVWVDGELIIDAWKDQGSTTYQAARTLTAGEHEVKVEYYEAQGDAVAKLSWESQTANQAPTPTIAAPLPSLKWKVGDNIDFSGSATDPEDGPIPAGGLSWRVILHHCVNGQCHDHPFLSETGPGGSFTAPDHGDQVYFEIVLTATDSAGKTGSTSVEVRPQEVRLTIDTVPSGLQVVYNDESGTAPLSRNVIVGSTRTIFAPSPQGNLQFGTWSDGGAQQHNVTVGAQDETYTATFKDSGASCAKGSFRAEYFNNTTLSGAPDTERCEETINNDWGDGAPQGTGVGPNNFSVRWTGTFDFEAGDYTFSATTDDGMRMWVDGELIIDAWKDQGASRYEATRQMTAGEHEVKVEYYEAFVDAVAKASWLKAAGG